LKCKYRFSKECEPVRPCAGTISGARHLFRFNVQTKKGVNNSEHFFVYHAEAG
jgi:hypothetical protein